MSIIFVCLQDSLFEVLMYPLKYSGHTSIRPVSTPSSNVSNSRNPPANPKASKFSACNFGTISRLLRNISAIPFLTLAEKRRFHRPKLHARGISGAGRRRKASGLSPAIIRPHQEKLG